MTARTHSTQQRFRIACFGGVYSNYLALEAAICDARRRGVDAMYCLGDLGAFGPHPDRVFPLLRENGVQCMQGNYDDSVARGLDDCQCGYTDPRDNHFAQISYGYTLKRTSEENRRWLATLPKAFRLNLWGRRVLFSHGSPRRVNEFLWESTTPTHFLRALTEQHECDVLLATHTGIKWHRCLDAPPSTGPTAKTHRDGGSAADDRRNRQFINVGVLGRPENDGRTCVWYTLLELSPAGVRHEFIPIEYDHQRLVTQMQAEGLPEAFQETIATGWWTTCLEILPSKERRRGKF